MCVHVWDQEAVGKENCWACFNDSSCFMKLLVSIEVLCKILLGGKKRGLLLKRYKPKRNRKLFYLPKGKLRPKDVQQLIQRNSGAPTRTRVSNSQSRTFSSTDITIMRVMKGQQETPETGLHLVTLHLPEFKIPMD